MSRHAFDPACPDCRPVLLDPRTGKVLPPEDRATLAVNRVWDAAPRAEQEAFHRTTVHSSKDPADLELMKAFWLKVQSAMSN